MTDKLTIIPAELFYRAGGSLHKQMKKAGVSVRGISETERRNRMAKAFEAMAKDTRYSDLPVSWQLGPAPTVIGQAMTPQHLLMTLKGMRDAVTAAVDDTDRTFWMSNVLGALDNLTDMLEFPKPGTGLKLAEDGKPEVDEKNIKALASSKKKPSTKKATGVPSVPKLPKADDTPKKNGDLSDFDANDPSTFKK